VAPTAVVIARAAKHEDDDDDDGDDDDSDDGDDDDDHGRRPEGPRPLTFYVSNCGACSPGGHVVRFER
jgi:hypothetical protein